LKIPDRVLSCLLILGGIGHTLGSFQSYKSDQMTLLWSLCASLFVFLFAAVSLIRAGRPHDRALAWVCLVAGLCWIAASLRFGVLIGKLFDFRPLIFCVLTLGLCAFCVRTLIGKTLR
jgi:peptidoglycan/LPS O-acetylase OafA/YrhL